jgi:hypothetical protein
METSVILVDRITNVAMANGLLRVECAAAATSPSGQEKPSGTVLIPAPVAAQVVQTLINAMQELDKKAREAAAAASTQGYPTTIPTGNMMPG